jgi:hypothetical protein
MSQIPSIRNTLWHKSLVAIFKIRKQRGRLISTTEPKQFDKAAGYTGRFFGDRNKVDKAYVQAPVCPQAEVKVEIQSMTSLRAVYRVTSSLRSGYSRVRARGGSEGEIANGT